MKLIDAPNIIMSSMKDIVLSLLRLVFLLLFLLGNASLNAQINTWIGGSSDWHSSSNWSLGVPNAAHEVVIASTTNDPIISNPAVASSIEIDNPATLTINSSVTLDGSGLHGIEVNGTLNINATGEIFIDNTVADAVFTGIIGNVINDGEINVGTSGFIAFNSTSRNGIRNEGNFINNGQIVIQLIGSYGIRNVISSIFTNNGNIQIDSALIGVWNDISFTNNGLIEMDNIRGPSCVNNNQTFRNGPNGIMKIGTLGGPLNINGTGVNNDDFFVNEGQIMIQNCLTFGIDNTGIGPDDPIFSNSGFIQISECESIGIRNANTFTNELTGLIEIDDVDDSGILVFNFGTLPFFENDGILNIGTNGSISQSAIDLLNFATFNNRNIVTIGGGAGSIGLDGINIEDNALFHNHTCATVNLFDNLNNTSNVRFINDGYMYLNTSQIHTPGRFDNNGIISDPQGTFPLNAAGFVDNGIVIDLTMLTVCTNVVAPSFDMSSLQSYTVAGVYSDPMATISAGTYNPATNTFTFNSVLNSNSTVSVYIELEDANSTCSVIVEWLVVISYNDTITFTGAGGDTNWHNPANWDLGIVPSFCHHVIIPAPFVVDVLPGQQAQGKSLCVLPNAFMNQAAGTDMMIKY